jgi:hypothetical protein
MFGKRKREEQRERGRQIGRAVAEYMDEIESLSWRGIQMRKELGEEAAKQAHPPVGVVDIVERLMTICGNDPNDVIAALGAWRESREERFEKAGDEDRALHVGGTFLAVGLNGVGNLFGAIPPNAPSFDPELAAAGRERGWRK